MDHIGLSRIGFTLIRLLLETRQPDDIDTAQELAEALHNLPDNDHDFLYDRLVSNLKIFADKHPELRSYLEQHVCLQSTSLG